MTSSKLENLLTTAEVADRLGVTRGRVGQFVMDGRLRPKLRIGTNLLFDVKVVAAFEKVPRMRGRRLKKTRRRG